MYERDPKNDADIAVRPVNGFFGQLTSSLFSQTYPMQLTQWRDRVANPEQYRALDMVFHGRPSKDKPAWNAELPSSIQAQHIYLLIYKEWPTIKARLEQANNLTLADSLEKFFLDPAMGVESLKIMKVTMAKNGEIQLYLSLDGGLSTINVKTSLSALREAVREHQDVEWSFMRATDPLAANRYLGGEIKPEDVFDFQDRHVTHERESKDKRAVESKKSELKEQLLRQENYLNARVDVKEHNAPVNTALVKNFAKMKASLSASVQKEFKFELDFIHEIATSEHLTFREKKELMAMVIPLLPAPAQVEIIAAFKQQLGIELFKTNAVPKPLHESQESLDSLTRYSRSLITVVAAYEDEQGLSGTPLPKNDVIQMQRRLALMRQIALQPGIGDDARQVALWRVLTENYFSKQVQIFNSGVSLNPTNSRRILDVGDPTFIAVMLGISEAEAQRFIENPDHLTPVRDLLRINPDKLKALTGLMPDDIRSRSFVAVIALYRSGLEQNAKHILSPKEWKKLSLDLKKQIAALLGLEIAILDKLGNFNGIINSYADVLPAIGLVVFAHQNENVLANSSFQKKLQQLVSAGAHPERRLAFNLKYFSAHYILELEERARIQAEERAALNVQVVAEISHPSRDRSPERKPTLILADAKKSLANRIRDYRKQLDDLKELLYLLQVENNLAERISERALVLGMENNPALDRKNLIEMIGILLKEIDVLDKMLVDTTQDVKGESAEGLSKIQENLERAYSSRLQQPLAALAEVSEETPAVNSATVFAGKWMKTIENGAKQVRERAAELPELIAKKRQEQSEENARFLKTSREFEELAGDMLRSNKSSAKLKLQSADKALRGEIIDRLKISDSTPENLEVRLERKSLWQKILSKIGYENDRMQAKREALQELRHSTSIISCFDKQASGYSSVQAESRAKTPESVYKVYQEWVESHNSFFLRRQADLATMAAEHLDKDQEFNRDISALEKMQKQLEEPLLSEEQRKAIDSLPEVVKSKMQRIFAVSEPPVMRHNPHRDNRASRG